MLFMSCRLEATTYTKSPFPGIVPLKYSPGRLFVTNRDSQGIPEIGVVAWISDQFPNMHELKITRH